MYKLSKYNFKVEYNDTLLLYNPLSNIIAPIKLVDKGILIKLLNNLPVFIKEKAELFTKFKDWGFIINKDFDEIDYIRLMNHKKVFISRYYRLTINPTLDCNMSCWYCTVDSAGVIRPNKRMSDAVIKNIKKHASLLIEKKLIDGIFLDWFGGEPMLYFYEVILPIASHIKDMAIKYNIPMTHHITTNGYLIDKNNLNEIKKISLNSFQITLDGNEEKHNKIRKHNGLPTFNKIIENINLICDKIENPRITLRINYDRKTLYNISEIIPKILKHNRNKIRVSFQKVFQIGKLDEDENLLLKKVIGEFEESGFRVTYWAFRPNSYHTCYSDKFYHAVVNYDGNVYKCTARDYSENIRAGVLKNNGEIEWNYKLLSRMFSKATFENDKCLNCKLLPLCFGPCIQKTYEVLIKKAKFKCLMEDSELSIDTFIISEAKKRNLI